MTMGVPTPKDFESHSDPCQQCGEGFSELYCKECVVSFCGSCWANDHKMHKVINYEESREFLLDSLSSSSIQVTPRFVSIAPPEAVGQFHIQFRSVSETHWQTVGHEALQQIPITITHLEEDTLYEIRAKSWNTSYWYCSTFKTPKESFSISALDIRQNNCYIEWKGTNPSDIEIIEMELNNLSLEEQKDSLTHSVNGPFDSCSVVLNIPNLQYNPRNTYQVQLRYKAKGEWSTMGKPFLFQSVNAPVVAFDDVDSPPEIVFTENNTVMHHDGNSYWNTCLLRDIVPIPCTTTVQWAFRMDKLPQEHRVMLGISYDTEFPRTQQYLGRDKNSFAVVSSSSKEKSPSRILYTYHNKKKRNIEGMYLRSKDTLAFALYSSAGSETASLSIKVTRKGDLMYDHQIFSGIEKSVVPAVCSRSQGVQISIFPLQ